MLSKNYDSKIRVGKAYQAQIPSQPELDNGDEEAMCIWSPNSVLNEEDIDEFVRQMKERNFSEDQALCILHYHNYDTYLSAIGSENFTSLPRIWDTEDKRIFHNVISKIGKDFTKLQELLPHKSQAELIDEYYRTKKNRKPQDKVSSGQTSSQASSVSDESEKSMACSRLVLNYEKRPRGLPEGFKLDVGNFQRFMNTSEEEYKERNRILQVECDTGISLSEQARKKVRKLSAVAVDEVKDLRPPAQLTTHSSVWSRVEIALLLKCFEEFGSDCEKVASILGTKSAQQVELYAAYIRSRGLVLPSKINS